MKRRSNCHDYCRRGTYMLTLVVDCRVPLLGELAGWTDGMHALVGKPGVACSELGMAIEREEIPKIHLFYPMVEVWKVCIMPDHIHLIVRIEDDLPPGTVAMTGSPIFATALFCHSLLCFFAFLLSL